MTTTTHPDLHGDVWESGYDGRYRLYTIEHVPFGTFPAYTDGGPSRVTYNGWGVSSSSLDRVLSSRDVIAQDDGKVTLNISRYHGPVCGPYDPALIEKHPLDGTKHATQHDADQAAYEAGCLAYMVYEKDRARYGLPEVG